MATGVFVGTEVKFKVNITSSGFNMDNDDWSVTIRVGSVSREFAKADCVHGEDGYYVCFDTTEFGVGTYYAIVRADVPDSDFPDGIRTEFTKVALVHVESL